jgi:spermidine synthase
VRAQRGIGPAYALSGACALVYQVVWTHAFTERFGASATTFLVVLCSFIGGLGLGAVFSRRTYAALEKRFGGRGLRNYGRTEIAIAVLSVVLFAVTKVRIGVRAGGYRAVAGEGLTFFTPTLFAQGLELFLAILAVGGPCFLMGLTFPYLCSLFPEDAHLPSRLYAANTFGASVAVLATEFQGFVVLGYLGCFAAAVAGTLAIGIWFARLPDDPPKEAGAEAARAEGAARGEPLDLTPALLSGFLCGGLQALCYVFVKLLVGPSRATFALLAFFSILGIWLASTFVHRFRVGRPFLFVNAWLGLAWCVVIWFREPALSGAVVRWAALSGTFRTPESAAVAASLIITGGLIFVPYLLWSLLLPWLCDRQQARGENLSRTYGWNTLSFLAGVLVFGWALQYASPFFAARVFALAAAAGLVLLSLSRDGRPARRPVLAALALFLALGIPLVPRTLEMRLIGGEQANGYRGGPWRSTPQHFFWILENPDRTRSLMFDGHSMSGSSAAGQIYMRAMAHVPLLLHPDPKRALLICFGVGMTADAIRTHTTIERVDVVDLNPSVYFLNRWFAPWNGGVLGDRRLRLYADDGRQFLEAAADSWDFVTMEPPPPLQPGISRLYSLEFYDAVRRHLRSGGIASQWLPEYQMDERGADLVVATFVKSFPNAFLFVGFGRELILVGSNKPFGFRGLAARLSTEPAVRAALATSGLDSPGAILATILRTDDSLRRTWPRGPFVRDGFASLDALQISSPVQSNFREGTWLSWKPRLTYDVPAVVGTLRSEAPAEAEDVERRLSGPSGLPRTVPPEYLRPRR